MKTYKDLKVMKKLILSKEALDNLKKDLGLVVEEKPKKIEKKSKK